MSASQAYASIPRCSIGQLSVANTARDGTGTIVPVFTAPANGSRIEAITIQATGPTTQGMVRLFIHDGTNARLYGEVPVNAIPAPNGTQAAFSIDLTTANLSSKLPIILPSGYSLRAATHNADAFNVLAYGGDF